MTIAIVDSAATQAYEHRLAVLADESVGGREFCRRLSAATDGWIRALAEQARVAHPRAPKFALVAVGGYGRGELAPFSDLDILMVHESQPDRVETVASALWYPIWDAGLKLGHAVRTVDDQLVLAKSDLDTATALLTARPITSHLASVDGSLLRPC